LISGLRELIDSLGIGDYALAVAKHATAQFCPFAKTKKINKGEEYGGIIEDI
jgi:hypothetical protein